MKNTIIKLKNLPPIIIKVEEKGNKIYLEFENSEEDYYLTISMLARATGCSYSGVEKYIHSRGYKFYLSGEIIELSLWRVTSKRSLKKYYLTVLNLMLDLKDISDSSYLP